MAIVALACPALTACGGGQPHNAAPSTSAVTAAFRGSSAPLVSLHGQAGQLLSGGTAAFHDRLAHLRGHPVVINKWASWCGPCQTEFPAFQRAAVRYGRRVAFIGVDSKDHAASAKAFLRRFPVTYPSYVDPHASIANSIDAAQYFPQTVYITARGKPAFVHAGPYETAAALERDIRFYLLR
ncbi:MAG TPA: TlpA disulfide reductase family protein [Solirubrobacteraceae bacterium]|nr:TlpA disulfide reductase family protein [Solirubrobacteraceae bacterium]